VRPARGGRCPRRARPSFVDESLFGHPAGARPAAPGFAPPWTVTAGPGSGSHTPSFCDESLFGAPGRNRAVPRLKKEDVAKLHALLWSPPPAPRPLPGLAPLPKGTPLRALRSPAAASPTAAFSEGVPTGQSRYRRRPESGSRSQGWAAPARARSQSVSGPSDGLRLASEPPGTERCDHRSSASAPATPRAPLLRGRSKSLSRSPLARSSAAAGGCGARPPWK
ncbi:RITA1 protein, partial [Turnix velox]|nr:RITA1 protein [Turnix velox]